MSTERNVKRYAAYYHGWCIAFGEHDLNYEEDTGIHWVFGESQVGFVVGEQLKRKLLRELLGQQGQIPDIALSASNIIFNAFDYPLSDMEQAGAEKFRAFVDGHEQLHMFLTSHFCYPPRTRIVTFAAKKPPIILYKEITPLRLKLV